MIEIKRCKICGSKKLITVKRYRVNYETNNDWRYVLQDIVKRDNLQIKLSICCDCGFLFYANVLDELEITKLYREEARFLNLDKKKQQKTGRKYEIDSCFNFLKNEINFSQIKKCIDIGAGDFIVLDKLMELYPGIEFDAIDPSYDKDNYKKARVFHEMIENFETENKYDLAISIHILEHIVDFNKFFSKVSEISEKFLYVEVPFQVGPGLFMNKAVNTQHINYFTPVSIKNLLQKHGFSIKKMEFDKNCYNYNGMPGMIRILAEKDENIFYKIKSGILSSIYFLLSPLIFIKSKI